MPQIDDVWVKIHPTTNRILRQRSKLREDQSIEEMNWALVQSRQSCTCSDPGLKKEKMSIISSPDWLSLPNGIWDMIMQKLPLEDCFRWGCVCSSCLSMIHDLKGCSLEQPRAPWLLMPDFYYGFPRSSPGDRAAWKFFNPATRKVRKIFLPELRESIICGCSEGWLILMDENAVDFRLYNPFTKAKIQLPPTATLPDVAHVELDSEGHVAKYHVYDRRWLESSILALDLKEIQSGYLGDAFFSSWGPSYAVVIEYGLGCHLAYARAGDMVWTPLQTDRRPLNNLRCTFSKGRFNVTNKGKLLSFDLSNSSTPPPMLELPPLSPQPVFDGDYFERFASFSLLQGSDELLMLQWIPNFPSDNENYNIFKLDQKAMEWVKVSNLRGLTFFRVWRVDGRYYSITCLSSKEPQGKCYMYSTDFYDHLKVTDMEDGRRMPCCPSLFKPQYGCPRPWWISPAIVNLVEPNNIG